MICKWRVTNLGLPADGYAISVIVFVASVVFFACLYVFIYLLLASTFFPCHIARGYLGECHIPRYVTRWNEQLLTSVPRRPSPPPPSLGCCVFSRQIHLFSALGLSVRVSVPEEGCPSLSLCSFLWLFSCGRDGAMPATRAQPPVKISPPRSFLTRWL